MHVRELDLDGADFGEVRVGAETGPALIVRSIQVDYTPAGLLQKKIKKVTASGIELYLEFIDGKFGFRGIDLESLLQRLQSRLGGAPDSSDAESLLALERLVLRNVTVHIRIHSRTYRISGDIDILPENMAFDRIACTALIYTRGQKMTLSADIDLNNRSNTLNFSAQNVILARFADLTGRIDGLHLSGRANIDANAILAWEPLKISKFSSTIEFDEIEMDVHHYQLQNPVNQKKQKLPWRIHLEAIDGNELMISATEMTAVGPLPLSLSQMQFRLKRTDKELQGDGKFSLWPAATDERQTNLVPFTIIKSLPLTIYTTLRYSKDGDLSFTLNTQPTKKETSKSTQIKFEQYIIKARPPVIEISGSVNKIGAETSYTLNITDLEIASEKGTKSKFPAVLLDGTAAIDRQSNVNPRMTFNLRLPGSKISMASAEFNFPRLTLAGDFVQNREKKRVVKAVLNWNDISLIFPGKDASITAVKGQIPIQWPPSGKLQAGSFSAGRLRYKDKNVGSVRGTIQQTKQGFDFSGKHDNKLIPDLKLGFRGSAKLFQTQIPETRIQFQREPPAGDIQINLEKLLPQAAGVMVNGRLSLEGDLIFRKPGMSGSLTSRINNAKLVVPEKKISIEGIKMAVALPDLPNIRSAPQQQLFFEKADGGGIMLSNGRIEFQIESLKSLFIEKSQFNWSDGNVDAYAIRISPGAENYRFILYCDRLNMAKVLEQFGAAKAAGEGTLNGRIPLQYSNGKLSFDDGFLFSTPGETGKIRLTDTEILTAGIPPDTPQYLQMELAREALKDYDISWAKLNITSEGEDVLLRMQLDGKPANLLPFVYKKDLGGFAKIEAEGKGSKFQGIRLNVNFRLPLNKMLQYKEIMQMIQ